MNQIIQQIEREHINTISNINKKNFKVGDDIIVNIYIPAEKGAKSNIGRTQKIVGRCIGIRNEKSTSCTFKVLKLEGTKSVLTFHLYSPLIKVDVKTIGSARRAKLNYLINKTGKALRIRMPKIAKKVKNKN